MLTCIHTFRMTPQQATGNDRMKDLTLEAERDVSRARPPRSMCDVPCYRPRM